MSVVAPSDLSITAWTPAANATSLMQGLVKVVNMTIGVAGMSCFSVRLASIPFSRGMARSMTMRSGWSIWALSIPSQPFSASPQITHSGCCSNKVRKLRRISGLSSTMRIDFTYARFKVERSYLRVNRLRLQSGKRCTLAYTQLPFAYATARCFG
jgi:hypothetical protein